MQKKVLKQYKKENKLEENINVSVKKNDTEEEFQDIIRFFTLMFALVVGFCMLSSILNNSIKEEKDLYKNTLNSSSYEDYVDGAVGSGINETLNSHYKEKYK